MQILFVNIYKDKLSKKSFKYVGDIFTDPKGQIYGKLDNDEIIYLTTEETERFIDKAYELGDVVARTGTEVVKATTLFKKMGYELQESMGFAKDALMWTNVADGLVTVDNAATMLISTMKAFGIESDNTMGIVDRFNEVKVTCLLIQ